MIVKRLLLNQMEDVRAFVELMMQKPYDVELQSGKYVINAKSIMGIFSLDLTKPLEMIAHCDPGDPIETEIEPYLLEQQAKLS